MKPLTHLVLGAVILVMGAHDVAAQSQFSVPLGNGVATAVSGPVFTSGSAVAALSGGVVHYVTGLDTPATASHATVALIGALAPAGPWYRLSDSVALYRSTGNELILVRDLPGNPTVLTTGLTAASAAFIRWTDSLAVQVDPTVPEFRVLDHDATGATLLSVVSPVGLSTPPASPQDPPYSWGPLATGEFVGVGPGADAMMATEDDAFVVLRAPPWGGYYVSWELLPPYAKPEGLAFNEAGTAASWNSDFLPSIVVTIIGRPGAGVTTFTTFSVYSNANPGPNPYGPTVVIGDPGDTFRAGVYDDATMAHCFRFINDAGTAPTLGAQYCDDAQGLNYTILAEREGASHSGLGGGGGPVVYTRFPRSATASHDTTVIQFPNGDPVAYARPHRGALVIYLWGGDVIVTTDLFGANGTTLFGLGGNWVFSSPALSLTPLRPLTLSPGRVAAFRTAAPGAPDELVVVTAPGTPVVGVSQSFPYEMAVTPTVPDPAAPIRVQATSLDPAYAGPTWLLLSGGLDVQAALGLPGFAPGSVAHLQSPWLALPVPMAGGFGELVFDLAGAAPSLAGFHVYGQVAFYDPVTSVWSVSDARLVVTD